MSDKEPSMWEGVVSTKLDKDRPRTWNFTSFVSNVEDGCGTEMTADCFLSQFEGKRIRITIVSPPETDPAPSGRPEKEPKP